MPESELPKVCVDASVIVPIVIFEEYTPIAQKLWSELVTREVEIIAPYLIDYEVVSAIYRKAFRGLITWDDAIDAVNLALGLGFSLIHFDGLPQRAFEIARELGRPTTYDAHYLAVAEHFDAIFWTADEKLYNVARDKFNWIKLLRDIEVDVT